MLYLWVDPKNWLNKLIAAYDRDLSPDQFFFFNGNRLTPEQVNKRLIFNLKVTQAEITKYDCIPNNSASPLVNQKVVDLLFKIAPNEVQFFDADIQCADGILTGYKLLNSTCTIKGIDHEKSIYTKMLYGDSILRFKFLTYKADSMENFKIARDKEYLGNLLVTEEIKKAFNESKIKGVDFVKPEEFYGPLSL